MQYIKFRYIIYFIIMYTIHTIMSLYIVYNLDFAFKRTLTPFLFFRNQFIKIIQLIFINFIINVFMCFTLHT